MSADDLTETLAAMRSRNDFGELCQDDGDALLSAVENVLALCDESDAQPYDTGAIPFVFRVRKALTDALGGA